MHASDYELVCEGIYQRWKQESGRAKFAIICSPYISSPVAMNIASNLGDVKADIYTSCRFENFVNRSSSINSLVSLAKKGHHIYSIDNLHAKITIFSDDFATLGSQNFTTNGTQNLEGNIIITDPVMISDVKSQIQIWKASAKLMSLEALEEIEELVGRLTDSYKSLQKKARKLEKECKPKESICVSVSEATIKDRLLSLTETQMLLSSEEITIGMATQFVRSCAWWFRHPRTKLPTRARGHADRIKDHYKLGWIVEFGANSFLVSKAITRTRIVINRFIENYGTDHEFSFDELVEKMEGIIAGCVANYEKSEYDFYELTGKHLVFGTQSINVRDAAMFMAKESGVMTELHSVD